MNIITAFLIMACGPTIHTQKNDQCAEYFFDCMDLHKSNKDAALGYCMNQSKALFSQEGGK